MPELDAVRGIAILLVLFYHGIALPNQALTRSARALLNISQQGWIGVNLFFVLSGFLITGILIDSRNRHDYFARFYIRRALRILPALYMTLVVLFVGGFVSRGFLALAAFFLANSAPLLGVPLQYPPLWSLAVEEHFYLLWPAAVRRFSMNTLAIFLGLIAILSPVVRGLGFMTAGSRPDFVPLYTWFNLDGLGLGALLAISVREQWCQRKQLKRIAAPLLVAGATAFVLMPVNRMLNVAFSATAVNFASVGLLSCMLLLGTSNWHFLVDRPTLKFLGYISYGLYLVHVLAFRVVDIFLARFPLLAPGKPLAGMLLRFAAGACLAILIAYLSRRSLEEIFLRIGFTSRNVGLAEAVTAQG
jgi:peptidoglycan/LPS O-acetylase OafA/YrhL